MLKIAPSIYMAADRNNLQSEVAQVQEHAELLHVDIADGKFVAATSFSPEEIKAIETTLPKDVHLMVSNPLSEGHIDNYADAGAAIITIHQECDDDLLECIKYIKAKGCKAGLAIKPKTSLRAIELYLEKIDVVIIMSVEPGLSGQKFMPEVLDKVRELRTLKPELDIEIDGGINADNIRTCKESGVNIFVAASAIYGKEDRVAAIADLRSKLN